MELRDAQGRYPPEPGFPSLWYTFESVHTSRSRFAAYISTTSCHLAFLCTTVSTAKLLFPLPQCLDCLHVAGTIRDGLCSSPIARENQESSPWGEQPFTCPPPLSPPPREWLEFNVKKRPLCIMGLNRPYTYKTCFIVVSSVYLSHHSTLECMINFISLAAPVVHITHLALQPSAMVP